MSVNMTAASLRCLCDKPVARIRLGKQMINQLWNDLVFDKILAERLGRLSERPQPAVLAFSESFDYRTGPGADLPPARFSGCDLHRAETQVYHQSRTTDCSARFLSLGLTSKSIQLP